MNLYIIKKIIPFLWPKDNVSFRIRVVIAFLSLICAKIFTVLIPISLIWVVDSFDFKTEKTSEFSKIECFLIQKHLLIFLVIHLILLLGIQS